MWIYYSTQILLFGAEFTQVYATSRGTGRSHDLRQPPAPAAHTDQPVGTGIG